MKILSIIPARGGSKGIPRKNLKLLLGKPLMVHTIEASVNSQFITKTVVSSDDKEILAVAKKAGATPLLRPAAIAGDKSTTEQALLHAVKELEKKRQKYDLIVLLQPTSPLRDTQDINKAIQTLISSKADSLLSVVPNHTFLWKNASRGAHAVNYDFRHRPMRQDREPEFRENGAIYITKRSILLKQKNRLGGEIALYVMDESKALEIDSSLDFEFIEYQWKKSLTTDNSFQIGRYTIGSGHPCFIICEIGINHNGSVKRAKQMVDQAIACGAHAVKFQMRNLQKLYRQETLQHAETQDLALQHSLEFIRKAHLSEKEFTEIARYCKKKDIIFLCTPFDETSVDILEKLHVPAYKVASADLTNVFLLDRLVKTKKPLILSTGMDSREQVQATYDYLKHRKANFALLHCNSTYPVDWQDIHLNAMRKMMTDFDVPIGYSGHERGTAVSLAAVTLGASILERHFTLDRTLKGPDHVASLEPDEFKALVTGAQEIFSSLGKTKKTLSQGILLNKQTLGKSLVARTAVRAGSIIRKKHLAVKSPGKGLSPFRWKELIGVKVSRDMAVDDYFYQTDLQQEAARSDTFRFGRPWGIPTRWHDLKKLTQQFQPDFVEFHWSAQDILQPVFPKNLNKKFRFKVHIPETWEENFLLNLCSSDKTVTKKSHTYVDQTVQLAERLIDQYSLSQKKVEFILHVGGFSTDAPISSEKVIQKFYTTLAISLKKLRKKYPQHSFLIENMPPLPWLLGGQRFHNILTRKSDIVRFCQRNSQRMCLDISHAFLYCQYSHENFFEYLDDLLPYSDHLHIADAQGINGEGIQIGQGQIPMKQVITLLNHKAAQLSFIPEIWQGHDEQAKGFTKALLQLQQLGL